MHNYCDNQKSLIGVAWGFAVAVDSNLQARLVSYRTVCPEHSQPRNMLKEDH